MNVTEHKLKKIIMRTSNKSQKYIIAHNVLNNIGMLHLKMIVLKRGIQLNMNFVKFELPSSHNYSK